MSHRDAPLPGAKIHSGDAAGESLVAADPTSLDDLGEELHCLILSKLVLMRMGQPSYYSSPKIAWISQ